MGKPLIGNIINGAQPIDAHLFKDDDDTVYLYYGGWGHCNLAIMNDDMTGFVPHEDGSIFKEITPDDYVEGPCVFKKDGLYYFMWSSGSWTNETYGVNYGTSDSPYGPFEKKAKILSQNPEIATGPGHNGYLELDDGKMLIVYHRHPLDSKEAGCRVLCIDKMDVQNGVIAPVVMTNECSLE